MNQLHLLLHQRPQNQGAPVDEVTLQRSVHDDRVRGCCLLPGDTVHHGELIVYGKAFCCDGCVDCYLAFFCCIVLVGGKKHKQESYYNVIQKTDIFYL